MRRYIPVGWFDWEPFAKRPKSWWPDLYMFLGFLIITVFLSYHSWLVQLDYDIRYWGYTHKVEWLREVAHGFSMLGQAKWVAPFTLGFAAWQALRARSIRSLLMYVLSFITLAIILGMKHLMGRPLSQHPFQLADATGYEGAILFTYYAEGGGGNIPDATAFPSGHAVNTILLFGLIVMLIGDLLPKWVRWTLLIAPPVLVATSQVYLGHHWFADEPAGILLGLILIRCAKRVAWHEIPLGPLKIFEPARRSTILIATILIVGCMITPTLHLVPALTLAATLPVLGILWLWLFTKLAHRRDAKAAAAEAAEAAAIDIASSTGRSDAATGGGPANADGSAEAKPVEADTKTSSPDESGEDDDENGSGSAADGRIPGQRS
ncbi:phosphatase PAP2 family protein [Glycomyces buryatensis]|uniref:phosphatase PAP2 family protein n=1 Tax=Glycomyces buryatensis TaxID=2570927 RepID=UPI0014562980|nr:phosphatase PAP2 family protein [Glycomyces buryatensis]